MKSLAVRVLGDFGVDGVEPQALGSRKARLALHLLALADGQAVPADVLIDALWEIAPPARPEDQLAVLMSRLRSVLGRDRIEHRDQGYLLHRDWLDAAELTALTREVQGRRAAAQPMGAVAAARVALSLIRGDGPQPLPGEWAQLRRAELERLISRSWLVAATALLEAGDWLAACDAASAAIERDPYDEAALRLLLRGYVAGGRVAAALAAYANARARMADDLGTDPSPETAALYTAILRGELTAGPGPGPGGSGLVGRDDELACLEAIAARARGGSTEVAVVDGEAGIGKTTLLRAWAGRHAADGDTALIASCGPLDRSLPLDAVLTALAGRLRELGPDESGALLGPDTALLAPALNLTTGMKGTTPLLADSMLGPGMLYSALVRVLGPAGGGRAAGARDRRRAPGQPGAGRLAAVRPARGHGGDRGRRHPDRRGRAAARDRVRPPGPARPGRRGGTDRASPGGRAVRPVEGTSAVPDRAGPASRGRGPARVAGGVGVRPLR